MPARKGNKGTKLGAASTVGGQSVAPRKRPFGDSMSTAPSHHAMPEETCSPCEQGSDEKIALMRNRVRDGRACLLCGAKDNKEPDPVFPNELIYWFEPPRVILKPGDPELWQQRRLLDFYCGKAFVRAYRIKYKDVKN